MNMILTTMFTLREKGKIVSVSLSNVDDLRYGSLPGYEKAIQRILDTFDVKVQNEGEFRFCGKEFKQNSDYSITVIAKDNTEKIRPIDIPNKKRLVDRCSDVEITALRSVVASIAWIARQVRPDLSYRVSKLQSITSKACVKDIKEANKLLDFALEHSDKGIYF